MASNLTVDTLTKGATTLNTDELVDVNNTRVCKAWVNFNGTGTVAIRAAYNVSSITDNGVGRYTVNFTNAMPDVDYVMSGSAGNLTGNTTVDRSINRDGEWTTSACFIRNVGNTSTAYDNAYVGVMFFAN